MCAPRSGVGREEGEQKEKEKCWRSLARFVLQNITSIWIHGIANPDGCDVNKYT
jgi:hypothetical protein